MILEMEQFMKRIVGDLPGNVILFAPGKNHPRGNDTFEPYLADEAVNAIVKAYVDPGMRDLTYTAAYAEETAPGAIAEEASTLPFLAERRVILVRNAEKYNLMSGEKRSPLAPLLDYLDNPSSTTILIFIASSVDKRKRFYKSCESKGVVVECPQLNNAKLAAWIKDQIRDRERTISSDGLRELMERVGGKLNDMANAITLVCNFVETGGAVTEIEVRAACADVAETTVWALTDAIAASKTAAALEALHDLFAMNKKPEEIIGTINWLLESAYKAMPETQANLEKRFVADKVVPLGKKFGLKKLIAALALCTKTHFAMRTTGADAQLMLEMLVIKLSVSGPARSRTRRASRS